MYILYISEQYDTFVKFTHDQLMRRFGEQPASCEFFFVFILNSLHIPASLAYFYCMRESPGSRFELRLWSLKLHVWFLNLFHLPLLQMFPECGTESLQDSLLLLQAITWYLKNEKKNVHHCKRFSLASLNETFLTVPYFCLWAKVYMKLLSVVNTLL